MKRRLRAAIAAFACAVALLLFSARSAMATETPAFDVVGAWPDAELRRYGPTVVAETRVEGGREDAGREGFRRLAGYIFGGNRARASIAMTAPVAQAPSPPAGQRIAMTAPVAQAPSGGGAWMVAFTMPRAWSMATLPVPDDPRVTLRELPPRLVLARAYRGGWSPARLDEESRALRAAAEREGLRVVGELTWARYDPPWTPPFLKRNEVMVDVER
jgi:hypothetical protein